MKREEYFNEIFLLRFLINRTKKLKMKIRKRKYHTEGLLLVPKKGFYDHLILLLDFPGFYSSIIQDLNFYFTTYMKIIS